MVRYDHVPQGQEPERFGQHAWNDPADPYTTNNPKRITEEELKELTIADYGLTPEAIKQYMFGLEVVDPKTGEEMSDEFYQHTIETILSQAEHKLDIAIMPRIREEYHDYRDPEYSSHMMTHLYRRPIIQLEEVRLEHNGRTYFNFPVRGWKVYHLFGHIQVSPYLIGQYSNQRGAYRTFMPRYFPGQAYGHTNSPQAIFVRYLAGLLPRESAGYNEDWEMPADLEKYILKLATKEIFQQWGRLIVQPGLASYSLQIDGISETRSTTQSAMYTVIDGYVKQIDSDLGDLEESLATYFGTNDIISV